MDSSYSTIIKWVYAVRINGGEWSPKLYSYADAPQPLDSVINECSMYPLEYCEFACFRNRPGWQENKPRLYRDCRNKSDAKIGGMGGLINALQSDWM